MFMTKKPEALTCQGSGARIQGRKSSSESFCSQKVSGTNFMTRLCQASLTWFSRSIRRLFLFTVVSGTDIKGVNILYYQKPAQNGGLRRLTGTNSWMMK